MSTSCPNLHALIRPVPVCSPQVTLTSLLGLFSGTTTDVVVCLDADYKPLGTISLATLLPFLQAPQPDQSFSSTWLQSLPIVTLDESCDAIAAFIHENPKKYYAVVDSEGKFQGLVNGWQLLPQLLRPELTERMKALLMLLDHIPMPLRLETETGQVLQQNKMWQHQVNPQAEFLHENVGLDSTPATPVIPVSSRQDSTLSTTVSTLKFSGPNLASDNQHIWKLLRFPLSIPLAHEGEPLRLVLATDITEQRQLCKELTAKNADLVQLNRLKDEFLACITHELKTPLTAVLGLSNLLKDAKLGPLNPRQSRYAQLIHQSGRQLMGVVNDILDLTRLETGQLKLNPEPVQLASLCDRAYEQALAQVVSSHNPDAEKSQQTRFTLTIEPGLTGLVADELRLRQMLSHLLENALKFTPPTGQVGLTVSRWQGWIDFTVWDTGIGIPESDQHLIFQKFQQLESPLTRQFEGAGLGLVLTQRLARAHGGDISFISKSGHGSRFTLLLPPSPPQGAAKKANGTPVQQPTPNQLVMIVEAVPHYIEGLTLYLQQLGYRVLIARSGTEALEKARQIQPRIIFLNPLLPLLSGWDVLTLLKSDPSTCNIPVLVTATRAEKNQAKQNRADGFLTLPVKLAPLRESLLKIQTALVGETQNITILHLNAQENPAAEGHSPFVQEFGGEIAHHTGPVNYRILEADDLEQADILARVWKPDALLLDGTQLQNAGSYLRSLTSYPALTIPPLITLDNQTTAIANQYPELTVCPCLIPITTDSIPALLQVIQVATGITVQPNILVASDELRLPPTAPPEHHAPHSFIHALTQYLQTAGFRTVLSKSWPEIQRQLANNRINLWVLHIHEPTAESFWLERLAAIRQQYPTLPILLVDYRDESKDTVSSLCAHATCTITDADQSMTTVLQKINQLILG
ncbi:ATP-binding protein [Spirulina major CS-329]|uniref:ATP-binding protein n=1 Tax=Spirulina TaxID=1154 RepID=UPI0023301A1A|nr:MULTISPECIES: ATP-binding protein [Spirulina]MDB9494476.1 ATP-binding protein [Spirulina subsalsa CS-330]MDB9503304.1 ATP-binding protein [Spirulina major CS-329]